MNNAGKEYRNRLQYEKSPYLLQHASNPVDWYPWGDEAFKKASEENKPVFLSIGYSTCHWCHVMEHESFEDTEVAALMNDVFVCIKVDREERPDIDNIYMIICQAASGTSGWPLTILMTPDKKPFYTATFIPKNDSYGMLGLKNLIPTVKQVWSTRKDELLMASQLNIKQLQRFMQMPKGNDLNEVTLQTAFNHFIGHFDMLHGGFGGAPKFPSPHSLSFLLRYWKRTGDSSALSITEKTLKEMRLGGIFDHLGFGFHRYSTDEKWLVPHFEKMLYDQALLAIAYLELYQATRNSDYADTAREIFTYVLRDMTDKEGAFYSAEDADSEGVEGKFYVWTEQEIRSILGSKEADTFIHCFNVKPEGNWTDPAGHGVKESNILHLKKTIADIAADMKKPTGQLYAELEAAREKLFTSRGKRVRPHRDDKVLTDWNGLMIAALARGTQVLGDKRYTEAAKKACAFIMDKMRDADGRLLHRWRDGEAAFRATIDDYAFLIWALIELYEATFDAKYLSQALDLNREQVAHFLDSEAGGFFFTPDDGEELLIRQKHVYDGALPSGNSVAMLNLIRLARMTADTKLEDMAVKLGSAASGRVGQFPAGHTQLLSALSFAIGPSKEVVLTGIPDSTEMQNMLQLLRSRFIPEMVVLVKYADSGIEKPAPFLSAFSTEEGKAMAYVCSKNTCAQPTSDPEEMLKLLGEELR
ncbi:MAG: thioredoxin domain-containing protein [Spirochaetota bacterium]